MQIKYLLYVFMLFIGVSSCVPTKRLTYLQESENVQDTIIPIQKKQDPYRLQIYDLLSVKVSALDDNLTKMLNPTGVRNNNAVNTEERLYFDGFVVDAHGDIRMPLLGKIPVLGLTLEEVRISIEDRLMEEFFKEQANVFVTVKLSGIRYTINGEIGNPGSDIIYRDQLTIMEAIANSGEIPITGDKTDVIIIRQYPLGQKVHHIDLTTIDAMNSPYYYLQPNDQIIVNPLPQKSIGTGTTGIQSFTTILTVLTALTTTILLFTSL